VGRQWLPTRRVRLRRELDFPEPSGLFDVLGDDLTAGGIVAGLAIAIVAVLLLLVVWPVVAIAVEVVILILLFLAGLAGRLVLRRPWLIVARTEGPPRATLAWHVAGWRASGEAVADVARALGAGQRPRPPGATPALLEP
jgi:hypothetical protein